MAQAKIYSNQDLVNGLAVVDQGDSTKSYDPGPGFSQHIPSGDSLTLFQVQDVRYRVHGDFGSGSWEH